MLPPPAPPAIVPFISNCSGYITKDEIMAGLEMSAENTVYMPFDAWCALLASRNLLGWEALHAARQARTAGCMCHASASAADHATAFCLC